MEDHKALMIQGPQGSGKTYLALALANHFKVSQLVTYITTNELHVLQINISALCPIYWNEMSRHIHVCIIE